MRLRPSLLALFGVTQAIPSGSPQPSAPHCKEYVVKEGDTCLKIAKQNKVTYAQVVSWNRSLKSFCSKIETFKKFKVCVSNPLGDFSLPTNTQGGTSVVTTAAPVPSKVPNNTTKNCGKYSQVKKGQDCSDLLTGAGITLTDFLLLNPQVWENCTNLWLDYYYCVKPVGSITTYRGHGSAPTTTEISSMFKYFGSSASNNVSSPLDRIHSNRPSIPLAKGTRSDCASYYWIENVTDDGSANCWALADIYSIDPEEFVLWNPSLAKVSCHSYELPVEDSTSTPSAGIKTYINEFAYPCTVSESQSYCVRLSSATDSPHANKGEDGDTSTVPMPERTTTKSTVSVTKTKPMVVTSPSPMQTGVTDSCRKFHKVAKGDTCYDLAQAAKVKLGIFYSWNPAVKTDCSALQLGSRLRLNRLFISPNERNLDVLRAVANHPTFRLGVEEIIWDDATLKPIQSYNGRVHYDSDEDEDEDEEDGGHDSDEDEEEYEEADSLAWYTGVCKADIKRAKYRMGEETPRPDILARQYQLDNSMSFQESYEYYKALEAQQQHLIASQADEEAFRSRLPF
ncbi:LysM domain-containing protein [Fusarium oxysporum f. sp. conglutinans]|nr:LysM domain-containing protein [Fusarium oxysporum f. sp. conglutinans]